ncbi:MAG: peptidylprolyl isomerase, partial [Acidobacteriota bacterium]
AVLTLHESNNDNDATLIAALRDGDWQVRRMAAEYLLTTDDRAATELERVLVDTAFQVRIAALTSLAPRMRVTLSCSSLLSALDDPNPAVVMNAIDVAPTNCTEKEVLLMWLRQKATSLGGAITSWHVPARALAALVRFRDPAAREINATVAATHFAWEVRQLSASLAETLKDEATALTLAADKEANVRAMALRALTTLKSAKRGPIALTNLQKAATGQGPLLLAAAAALPDTTPIDDVRKAMEPALFAAGNSREVLLGLIARYRKFPFADSRQLRLLLRDQDPLVAAAAAAALTDATGNVVAAEPYLVSPIQTSTLRTRNPARYALMELSTGGPIKIELLIDDAPITVRTLLGRWLPQYFREGFIEVSPGIGARTGGVYDNPLDGWSAVMRDELGEVRHTRGTVAMMSNGHDLVNGQFFINLIDRPDLDHGYTVFGRIVSGIENADKILPGTRITRLTLTER